ncbi:MAG: hypothetical protein IKL80_00530, partial [Clostridia bacterium]|nr:hypothetical protein [Clostridia bacterium]
MDDETDYEISEDCIFVKNTEEFSGTINLMDRYVKIAADGDEIVLIEAWDFTDVNGIITDAGASFLSYKVGNDEKRLDKIADVAEKLVIIDGEIRTYKELKAGMVFSYWRDTQKDILVVAASERTLTDTLVSYSPADKSLSIGNLTINHADALYFSKDGVRYSTGTSEISEYFNLDVTVRLNIYGEACYVTRYAGESKSGRFMGYLLGIAEGQAFGNKKARIANVENADAVTKIYDMAKNVTYGDGLDSNVVERSAGTKDGSALYEIELNAKGEVKAFYKLKEYEGFEGQSWSGIEGSFIEHYNPYLVVNSKKLFIPGQTPVLCIHDDGGEVEFYNIQYQSLVGKECNDKITLRFYGYEDAPELKLVVMAGNVDVVSGNRGAGVVERCGVTLDESGEEVNYMKVNGTSYIIKEGSASGIEEGKLVNYTVSLFEPDSAIVEESLDIKDIASLDGKTFGQMSYKYGYIEKVDRLKIILDGSVDGSLCYYFENAIFYGVDEDGKLSTLTFRDLDAGMEVTIGIETASNGGQSVTVVYVRKN